MYVHNAKAKVLPMMVKYAPGVTLFPKMERKTMNHQTAYKMDFCKQIKLLTFSSQITSDEQILLFNYLYNRPIV
jgi:hypothetical protein